MTTGTNRGGGKEGRKGHITEKRQPDWRLETGDRDWSAREWDMGAK